MPSQGLMVAGGIGQGLLEGLKTFRGVRQDQMEQQRLENDQRTKNTGLMLDAASKGYDVAPGTGGVYQNEFGKNQQALNLEKERAQIGLIGAQTKNFIHKANQEGLDKDSAKVFTDLNQHNDEYKKAKASLDKANGLRDVVGEATVNPAAAEAMKLYAAQYISPGRMSQQEIQALSGHSPDWENQFKQILNTKANGTLTPANAAFMQKFIDVTSKTHSDVVNSLEDEYTGNFARRKKMDPDASSGLIFGHPTHATQNKKKQEEIQKGLMNGPQVDPQIDSFAKAHNMDYGTAEKIIQMRQKNMGAPRAQ